MKDNCDKNESNLRLNTKAFTPEEKKAVAIARKKLGIDRPVFYHDAIVKYTEQINGEEDA